MHGRPPGIGDAVSGIVPSLSITAKTLAFKLKNFESGFDRQNGG
jgi:hypothetical protein